MVIDWDLILHAPVYRTLGIDCVFTLAESGEIVTLTGLDKSAGLVSGKDVEVATIQPACAVRVTTLTAAGIEARDLKDARLLMGGKSWRVRQIQMKPAPSGEAAGESLLFLSEVQTQ